MRYIAKHMRDRDNFKKKCKYCIDRTRKDMNIHVRREKRASSSLSARSVYVFLCVERRASAPWPCNMPCFAHCRLTTCSPRDVTAHQQQQSHNPQSGPSLLSRTRSQSHQGCRKTRPKIAEADSPPLLVHCLRSA